MKIATREIVREIDRITIKEYGISGLVLMENAGKASANLIIDKFDKAQNIAIICGSGNNGGDGFVIARHLISAGKKVRTYLLSRKSKYKGDSKTNLNSLLKIGGEVIELDEKTLKITQADIYIDAIFGTGLDRQIEGFYKKIIKYINSKKKSVISIDIPSGLDSNTGKPLGEAVKAEATITFIKPKIGMCIYPGVNFTGKLYVADITTPKELENEIEYELLTFSKCKNMLKIRSGNTHKGTYGHLLVIAGSRGKSGASILTTNAAVKSGTGLVTAAIPKGINKAVEKNCIEAMSVPFEETKEGTFRDDSLSEILKVLKDKKSALAIGPGISTNAKTKDLVKQILLKSKIPMVIDADALNILSEDVDILKKIKPDVILTPHPGEMARLINTSTNDVQNNRVEIAKEFARKFSCFLILKGARSVIATPDGDVYINPTGNPGMATGGSGDVLTGIVGSFLAQKYSTLNAAILGTFIHGFAGDIASDKLGQYGITATDILDNIQAATKRIPEQKEIFFEIVR